MVTFKQKNIISVKTLGEELRRTRKKFNLTLGAVERRLGIAHKYLEAMENNDWESLPGEIYAKNFFKKYIDFLGLPKNDFLERYKKETSEGQLWSKAEKYRVYLNRLHLLSFPRILRNVGISIVVVVAALYIGSQVLAYSNPPKLEVLYPNDNYVSQSRVIKILGKVEDSSLVRLNDKEVAVGVDGYFQVDLDLNKGLNVIKLEAEKSTGKTAVEYRSVIVE